MGRHRRRGRGGRLLIAAARVCGLVLGLAHASTAAAARPSVGTSRVVLFGAPEVTSVHVVSMETFRRGEGTAGAPMPTPRMLDADRVEVACPTRAACSIRLVTADGRKLSAEVFAMEDRVELDVAAVATHPGTLRVTYREPNSASAAMAAIASDARALARACDDAPARSVTAAFIQRDLLARTRQRRHPLAADVATLALAEGRCAPMPEDEQITEAALAVPTASPSGEPVALAWWPGGLVEAAGRVDARRGWATIDAAVASLARPEPASALLLAAYLAANATGDSAARQSALARLHSPALSDRARMPS
jgi:hypothetical protein